MAQATFEFSPLSHDAASTGAANGLDAVGFAIGWDHAHHRVTPPLAHLDGRNPVGQGWTAGRAAFGERRLRATAAVRQWLALRLQAWAEGAAFEDQQVNPAFLARIDADICPVTRTPLLLATGGGDDATALRLNSGAAYAAGNLAVVSHRVAQAWGADGCRGDWAAAQAHAAALADGQVQPPAGGLDADAWQRLVVLASFATPLPHARAALLPLRVLPPNRVRVINPVQALQVMLTLQFNQAGYARRLLGLAALVQGVAPGAETRQAFQIFMHTLLARRLAVGPQATPLELRQAMEDTWGDVLVQRRWQRLASRLDAAACELLLQRASQRALVVGGGRWLSTDAATDGWALCTPVQPAGRRAPVRQSGVSSPRSLPLAGLAARPGSARSRGSQNAAS